METTNMNMAEKAEELSNGFSGWERNIEGVVKEIYLGGRLTTYYTAFVMEDNSVLIISEEPYWRYMDAEATFNNIAEFEEHIHAYQKEYNIREMDRVEQEIAA